MMLWEMRATTGIQAEVNIKLAKQAQLALEAFGEAAKKADDEKTFQLVQQSLQTLSE